MTRMRTIMGLGAVAAFAFLAGCGHEGARLGLGPDYGLFYNDQGKTVALAYGLPNSDDVALMLQCAKGSGDVEVSDTARDGAATVIVLSSDGRSAKVPVWIEPADSEGPRILSGKLKLASPALQGFRRSGKIEVANGPARYIIAAAPGERDGVERFFRVCG